MRRPRRPRYLRPTQLWNNCCNLSFLLVACQRHLTGSMGRKFGAILLCRSRRSAGTQRVGRGLMAISAVHVIAMRISSAVQREVHNLSQGGQKWRWYLEARPAKCRTRFRHWVDVGNHFGLYCRNDGHRREIPKRMLRSICSAHCKWNEIPNF
jgi:hypothetical protein